MDLEQEQQSVILSILEENEDCFSKVPGHISGVNYKIEVNDTEPITSRPYKIPFHLKEEVKQELDKWMDLGIIRKSTSAWTSPMVVVRNSDNTLRLTVDFRKLNPHVNVDNYPMPDRDSVIEKLGSAKYLSKVDLTKAYFHILLDEESRKYTSFVTEFGQYEFSCVPFGIRFASGLCNRLLKEVLGEFDEFVTSFVDDLVIYSNDFETHLEHLRIVFKKMKSVGITLNKRKCEFGKTTVKFLGFIVGQGEIKPDMTKVEALRNFPIPIKKKDLRSFLGLLNFYRKFLPRLSHYIANLTDMLRKSCPNILYWTDETRQYFREAVELLSADVVLTIPQPGKKFILQTDASFLGLAGVLGQEIDGVFKPIMFMSRKLNAAERNYSVIELECLAIKWSINYCHEYLYGSHFSIRSDHAPLQWLTQNKDKSSRLMRWALSLQGYNFSIEYIKGSENFLADTFSRNFPNVA